MTIYIVGAKILKNNLSLWMIFFVVCERFLRGHNAPTLFVVGNKGGLTEARVARE